MKDDRKQDDQNKRAQEQNESLKNSDKNGHNTDEASRHGMDPGRESVAKTERKGAGQQQDSAGNPVINS